MRPLNDRWEFVNGVPVNICIDCKKDFGDEYIQIRFFSKTYPNVTNLASTIRCQSCVGLLDDWIRNERQRYT